MGTKREIIIIFIVCLITYIMGIFAVRGENKAVKSRVLKKVFMIYFLTYIFLLLKYTMFDGHFGREFGVLSNLDNLENAYKNYIATRSNFNLFETVTRYTQAFIKGNISLRLYLINIWGNVAAFMPFALFLPMFSKKAKHFLGFFVQVFIIGLSIEVVQILLMTGSFDVDDIFLNVLGALFAYAILHTKMIYSGLNRLTGKNY